MKWFSNVEKESEKLILELTEIDEERLSPRISEEKKKRDALMLVAHQKLTDALVLGNTAEASTARAEFQSLGQEKFNLENSLYQKRVQIEEKLRRLTSPVISECILALTQEIKKVLGMREHEIVEKSFDGYKATKIYSIKNNWPSISTVVENLMTAMDRLRTMDLSPISEIKKTFENAVKSIPDTGFPLDSMVEGGEGLLARFKDAESSGITISEDSFAKMNIAQTKVLSDVNKLKTGLKSLKSFFARA
jgi:hypothetical protein